MTTKHTPGPWTVSDNHGKRYIEPVGDNEPVAMICRGYGDSYSANASLIAAAPSLLASLIAASNYIDTLGGNSQSYRIEIEKALGAQ